MAKGAIKVNIFTVYDSRGTKALRRDLAKLTAPIKKVGKYATMAFGAATAAAGAFAAASVKAALEDQASQALLQQTMKNTIGVTKDSAAAVEQYIAQLQSASGVLDDQLRPSLATLLRATHDMTKAQKLQTLALDISAATGRDLETVSLALSKGYQGNFTTLGRLGGAVDKATLKSGDFAKIITKLNENFGGAAQRKANTYQGKIDRLKVGFKEISEGVGRMLLPIIIKLTTYLAQTALPAISSWLSKNGKNISAAFKVASNYVTAFLKTIYVTVKFVGQHINFFKRLGVAIAAVFVASKVAAGAQLLITTIKTLITLYKSLKSASLAAAVAQVFATGGKSIAAGIVGVGAFAAAFTAGLYAVDKVSEGFDAAKATAEEFNVTVDTTTTAIPDFTTGLEGISGAFEGITGATAGATKAIKDFDTAAGELAAKNRAPQIAASIQANQNAQISEMAQQAAKVYGMDNPTPVAAAVSQIATGTGIGSVARGEYGNTASQPINVTVQTPLVASADELGQWVADTINRKLRTGAALYSAF